MVIQRWQSVLLLVAAAVMACFTFCSLGQFQTTDFTFDFTSMGISYEGEATDGAPTGYWDKTWYFFAVSLMSAIIPLVTIFLFGNLRLQMRMCLMEILFVIATGFVAINISRNVVEQNAAMNASFGWSAVALSPFIALMAVILAYWRIRHDRNLLRSADRIR